jgi:hypothetical protein
VQKVSLPFVTRLDAASLRQSLKLFLIDEDINTAVCRRHLPHLVDHAHPVCAHSQIGTLNSGIGARESYLSYSLSLPSHPPFAAVQEFPRRSGVLSIAGCLHARYDDAVASSNNSGA